MEMIGLTEWCERIGVSKQWAAKWCRDGRIPGARIEAGYRWILPSDSRVPERLPNPRIVSAMLRRERREHE